jgi:iron(III) transport system substrate-binding protein
VTDLSRRELLGAGAATLLLAGCGVTENPADDRLPGDLRAAGGMESLIAKARAEGGLLIYGSPSQDKFLRWVKLFEHRYGIPVQYYRSPSSTVYQRLTQEYRAGRRLADLLSISDVAAIRDAAAKRVVTHYTPADARRFPVAGRIDGIAYPLFVTAGATAWNTGQVPADLQANLAADPLGAMLDPRLKGRIVAVDVTAGGPQLATNANLTANLAGRYGWPYLRRLAAQEPVVVRTGPVVLDGIVAGDYWATLDGYDSLFAPAAVAGAPIAFRYPDPAPACPFYLSVMRRAAHPYAARLFAEWASSIDGQSSLATITNSQVLIEGFADKRAIRSLPWYRAPEKLYLDWQSDPHFANEDLRDYYRAWHTAMES